MTKKLLLDPENSRHFLNQSDVKLKQITTWSPAFSRSLGSSVVFSLSCHWLLWVFSLLICRCCWHTWTNYEFTWVNNELWASMNTPTIAENSKVEHKQQKAFLREQPFPMNGKYNKRSFVRKTGSMSSGLWIYVMSAKGASPVRENRKYMSFARIRLFSPGEAGLKKNFQHQTWLTKNIFIMALGRSGKIKL